MNLSVHSNILGNIVNALEMILNNPRAVNFICQCFQRKDWPLLIQSYVENGQTLRSAGCRSEKRTRASRSGQDRPQTSLGRSTAAGNGDGRSEHTHHRDRGPTRGLGSLYWWPCFLPKGESRKRRETRARGGTPVRHGNRQGAVQDRRHCGPPRPTYDLYELGGKKYQVHKPLKCTSPPGEEASVIDVLALRTCVSDLLQPLVQKVDTLSRLRRKREKRSQRERRAALFED